MPTTSMTSARAMAAPAPPSRRKAQDPHAGSDKLLDHTFLHTISTAKPVAGTKRALLSLEPNDEDETTSGDKSDGKEHSDDTASPTRPKKKQPKPTHVLRREAKDKLVDEIRHLEARAALLRQETGQLDRKATEQRLLLNANLREALLQQDLVIATTQSLFSGLSHSRATSPIETDIHLTSDWEQRRQVLLDMKDEKIRYAHRFLVERTRHMNPFKKSCEVSQFESDDGDDLCTVRVDVTPFEGVKSMRQVFEALQFYLVNLEITHTEMSGNVTIRENEDDTEKAILQHRLVTSESSGVLLEKNAVMFLDQSGVDADNIEDQYAVVAGDFVNQDDLYPYCPTQRIRKDATSVIKLSVYRRRRATPHRLHDDDLHPTDPTATDELVVVLMRWFLLRIRRHPDLDIPKQVFQAVSNSQSRALDAMLQTMQQCVFPTATAPWCESV
ncbi:hypothetical protein FI667_g7677, partial [Globisporangium splendens]